MSIAWLAPAALIGLGLVVLPIAIHLLVRQHARTLAYPSLRFLRETQLAAFRRRTIQDASLLACRVAIVALAAAALAGPVLRTPSRTAGYAARILRAVVTIEGAGSRPAIADSLMDAIRWLGRQPPSSREIVIAGTLRRGSVTESDLAIVPEEIGIRFEHAAAAASSDVAWPVLTRRNGSLMRVTRSVHFDTDATRVADGAATAVPNELITIVAREADTPLAQAALRAALDAGVTWSDFESRVVIAWEGADEGAITRASPAARTIRMPVPSPPSAAADAVLAALGEASPRRDHLEPVMITPEQLASWSRRPGPPPTHAPVADEGDRRWLWGAVLALLALEAWMRRNRPEPVAVSGESEARVA